MLDNGRYSIMDAHTTGGSVRLASTAFLSLVVVLERFDGRIAGMPMESEVRSGQVNLRCSVGAVIFIVALSVKLR